MTKRTLIAVGLAGALALPAGTAMASARSNDPVDTQLTVVPDRDRDQIRLQDPTLCDGGCAGYQSGVMTQATSGDQEQAREQARLQTSECDGDGAQIRGQARSEASTGAGMGSSAADGQAGGYGSGPQDGSGPIHVGPADGTGQQYGQAGR